MRIVKPVIARIVAKFRLVAAAAAILLLSLVLLAQQSEVVELETPPSKDIVSLAISPDGKRIAFVAVNQGIQQLWVRTLDSGAARPLPGTEYALEPFPFWSPDSKSLAFAAEGSVKSIDVDTGIIRSITNITSPFRGGSWGSDGTILLATAAGPTIFRVSSLGGPPTPATQLSGTGQALHVFPSFLPDGRHFLYYALGSAEARGVYVGQLGRPGGTRIVDADAAATYTSNRLLFVRRGTLLAQPFDLAGLTLTGQPVEVAQRVPSIANAAAVSAAAGSIIYRSGFAFRSASTTDGAGQLTIRVDVTEAVDKQFKWFDRSGKELSRVGVPTPVDSGAPTLSPDEKTVAFARTRDGNTDIWLLDLETEQYRQFTTNSARENFPFWAPDGRSVVYASNRSGLFQIFRRNIADGAESLAVPGSNLVPKDVSADGKVLLVQQGSTFILAVQSDGRPLLVTPINPTRTVLVPQLSPNGQWIAFQSNMSGMNEIHVAKFAPGVEFRPSPAVSDKGGAWPMWARDGKELFYAAPDGMLMSVPFDPARGTAGKPARLFAPPMLSSVRQNNYLQQYLVSKNGRFLVIEVPEVRMPIQWIGNWRP